MPEISGIVTVILGTVFTLRSEDELHFTVRYNFNNNHQKINNNIMLFLRSISIDNGEIPLHNTDRSSYERQH